MSMQPWLTRTDPFACQGYLWQGREHHDDHAGWLNGLVRMEDLSVCCVVVDLSFSLSHPWQPARVKWPLFIAAHLHALHKPS